MAQLKVYQHPIKETVNKAGQFKQLIDDDQFEIYESVINKGKSILCRPSGSKNALTATFVLSGKLYHTNERKWILTGEHFTYRDLEKTQHLQVMEETKLLIFGKKNIVEGQLNVINDISSLIHKIHEKDFYTEDHCNNTGNLAVQIATHMDFDEHVIENVLYAGKIHDVGKINVPKEILNKPTYLTKEEFECIKKHPKDGHDIILKTIQNSHLARIVHEHHETLDGTGYPRGLKGDEISIEARIILVADSFDAMTSDRPYRKALSETHALMELQKYAGIWYDPSVVDALVDIYRVQKKQRWVF